jgi:hypothetical protein
MRQRNRHLVWRPRGVHGTGRHIGLVEVNINPGGSMLVVFRGFCQNAGHFMNKVPLAVMKSLGGYDPANVVRKKRPRKKAA